MKTNALDLPDECWELIFNRCLRGRDDNHYYYKYHLDSISLVCKRFLSISNFFLRTLTISFPKILHHCNLSKLFRRFNHINRICIHNCILFNNQDLDRVIIKIALSGLNLEELNLSSSPNDFYHQFLDRRYMYKQEVEEKEDTYMIKEASLRKLDSNMNNLKTLKYKYCRLSDNDLIVIGNSLPRLQELDITVAEPYARRQFITEEKLLELISKLKELRKFNISGYRFSSVSSIRALSLNCAHLSEVDLGWFDFLPCYDYIVNAQVYALQYFSNLNSLHLHYLGYSPFENYISHARSLRALKFRSAHLSDTLLCSIAEAHLPLKKLTFIYCEDLTFSGLSLLLHEYQSLDELCLLFSEQLLTVQHLEHLSKYLCNLTRIELSCCLKFTNSAFFTLTRSCPSLVYILMTYTKLGLGDEEESAAADYLKKNNQIQHLKLSHNSFLNDETLKKIGYVCPNLQILDTSDCLGITGIGIGQILNSCSNIRHLQVNGCKRLKMIVGTESEHSKKLRIEILEAEDVDINEKGMAMIGMRCPRLLKLNLNFCKVKGGGVMEVVEKCSNLMEIQLAHCSGCSTDVLYRMLHKRPSLRKIVIDKRPWLLTEEEMKLFIRHGCQVYISDHDDNVRKG